MWQSVCFSSLTKVGITTTKYILLTIPTQDLTKQQKISYTYYKLLLFPNLSTLIILSKQQKRYTGIRNWFRRLIATITLSHHRSIMNVDVKT